MDGEQGIEEVGEVDAMSLGHKAKEAPVAIETPRSAVHDDVKCRLVRSIEDAIPEVAGKSFVG
jgi:hypothetical protein